MDLKSSYYCNGIQIIQKQWWDVHIVRPDEGSKDKLYDRDMKKFHYLGSKKENR